MPEINFDGLIGPTHNYSGLSDGNIASKKNFFSVSNPKEAALQGLKKAKILINAGLNQGLFLPHERPFIPGLKKLGFSGDNETILKSAYEYSKVLLSNFSSASSMWAANAATISPSPDTKDGKVHITPANLNTMFHRSLESDFTYTQCKLIFSDTCFVVHKPALSISGYGDEGAANHLRISKTHEDKGFEIFVFGESGFKEEAFAEYQKTSFIKRQALEVSKSVALSHKLDRNNVFYLQQHPRAIDKGSFHNDIVSLSNENIFIAHEKAFLNRDILNHVLEHLELEVENFNYIEIPDKEIPLDSKSIDYCLIVAAWQYLQYPEKLTEEILRILSDGGKILVSFSNRAFWHKAPNIWTNSNEEERVKYVRKVLITNGFNEPRIIRKFNDSGLNFLPFLKNDPFYCLIATKE